MHAVFHWFSGLEDIKHVEQSLFGDFSTVRVCLCVLNKEVYIKIVVIVNDDFSVDKSVYLHVNKHLDYKKVAA